MFTKVSQLWFEEVSKTGNTDLTLSNFAVKLFKEGNLYNGTTKVDSFLDALSSPEKFSARAELKIGKSILKEGPFEVVQLDALDELHSFMNNYGSDAKSAFDSVNHAGPYYASIVDEQFCALSCKENENRILITKTGKCLETKDYTLPDFLNSDSILANKIYGSLNQNHVKSLCACLSLPVEAYAQKEKKIAETDDSEEESNIHNLDFLNSFADEEIERLLKNSLKDTNVKNVKFNKDPLPEKIWMKKKKDSGQPINRFKRERLYKGELTEETVKVASVSESVKLDLNNAENLKKTVLKLPHELLKKPIKKATIKKQSYSLFENYGETIKCPNCEMDMVKIRLAGGLSGIYCTTCKHADYDGKIKSRVNAGNPSVEKKITLNCLDSGNCEIKK